MEARWDDAVRQLLGNDPAGYKLAVLLWLRNEGPIKYRNVYRKTFDPAPRQKRQFDQLVAFTQQVMRDSERVRRQSFWSKLDFSSPARYEASTEGFRKQMWEEGIGKLPQVRSR